MSINTVWVEESPPATIWAEHYPLNVTVLKGNHRWVERIGIEHTVDRETVIHQEPIIAYGNDIIAIAYPSVKCALRLEILDKDGYVVNKNYLDTEGDDNLLWVQTKLVEKEKAEIRVTATPFIIGQNGVIDSMAIFNITLGDEWIEEFPPPTVWAEETI